MVKESEKYVMLVGTSKAVYRLNGPRKANLLSINSKLVYKVVRVDRDTLKEINIPTHVPATRIERDIREGVLKDYKITRQLDINF